MNLPLFKQGCRSNSKILLLFAAVLTMYISLITTMFDPKIGSILDQMVQTMPEIMAAVGMSSPGSTLISFLNNYLYGFLMLLFPMLYSVIVANRLIARHVDKGSMAYLLASPVSRTRVAFTQLGVLLSGLALLIGYCTALGILCAHLFFPGELDVGQFLLLNIGALLLHTALAGIAFFASCIADETRISLSLGAGLPILFYIFQMLANMGGGLKFFRYLTPFTLFDSAALASGEAAAFWGPAILGGAALLLFAGGILLFRRRDLPL